MRPQALRFELQADEPGARTHLAAGFLDRTGHALGALEEIDQIVVGPRLCPHVALPDACPGAAQRGDQPPGPAPFDAVQPDGRPDPAQGLQTVPQAAAGVQHTGVRRQIDQFIEAVQCGGPGRKEGGIGPRPHRIGHRQQPQRQQPPHRRPAAGQSAEREGQREAGGDHQPAPARGGQQRQCAADQGRTGEGHANPGAQRLHAQPVAPGQCPAQQGRQRPGQFPARDGHGYRCGAHDGGQRA
jgi:hypothetical protein